MNEEMDARMLAAIAQAMERLEAAGKTPDEISDLAGEALSTASLQVAPNVADTLVTTMPKMLRQHRRAARSFRRRLRRDWGPALDLMYAVIVSAEEAGSAINRNRPTHGYRFEAVTGIMARACRTAFEAHHLLSDGFPLGALARSRTLHELAVNALIIETYGDPDGPHGDLAHRYLEHGLVLRWQDAKAYQQHHEMLGTEPFSDVDMKRWNDEYDELIARYGITFKEAYGWAAPLHPSGRPNFSDLEKLADSAHMRSVYKWASHEVHADARGSALNVFVVDGRTFRSTGSTTQGLADPAVVCANSLVWCLMCLVMVCDPVPPSGLLAVAAVRDLANRSSDAFVAAEERVALRFERRDPPGVIDRLLRRRDA